MEATRLTSIGPTGLAVQTGHAFLNDIAHTAVPVSRPASCSPTPTPTSATPHVGPGGNNLEYDNELLDGHFIAGDGRVNENIGLTTVHHVFHAEHNRLVQHIKDVAAGDAQRRQLLEPVAARPVAAMPTPRRELDALEWNGERLFQAAKFGTEMQYQHLVFEEFARTIQPKIDPFFVPLRTTTPRSTRRSWPSSPTRSIASATRC